MTVGHHDSVEWIGGVEPWNGTERWNGMELWDAMPTKTRMHTHLIRLASCL